MTELLTAATTILSEMLTSSRDGIIAEYVSFQFDLIKSMFENVADANNSHKLIGLLDRQVRTSGDVRAFL